MAACFAEHETDDPAHPGVVECFNEWLASRPSDECEQKKASKRRICEITLQYSARYENVEACLADDDYIPTVVEHGVGE